MLLLPRGIIACEMCHGVEDGESGRLEVGCKLGTSTWKRGESLASRSKISGTPAIGQLEAQSCRLSPLTEKGARTAPPAPPHCIEP